MHALVHYGECANPFWVMRHSILSNAPVYFGECLEVFGYSGIQVFRVQHNNNNNNSAPLVARGVRKGLFQQSDTTHSGTGEKKINVVGKKDGRRRRAVWRFRGAVNSWRGSGGGLATWLAQTHIFQDAALIGRSEVPARAQSWS